MCFIASSIRILKKEELINPISKIMIKEQVSNKDGTGAYCFNQNDNKVYQARTMTETKLGIKNSLKDFDIVNYHFRSSTGGEHGLLNIHFWKIGKWVFAHNGTASNFQKGKECDSLGLFKTMIKKHFLSQEGYINIKKIKKFINDSTFWGRFILINSETKKIYYFGDWHIYLINRSYLVITSSIVNFESKETIEMLGITFETDEEIPLEILETKLDGIFTFSFNEGFILEDNEFKKSYSYKDYCKKNEDKEIEKLYLNDKNNNKDDNSEYFGSNEYQEELSKIDKKYQDVVKRIGNDYSKQNIQELEIAENEREFEIEVLDEKYFGLVCK